MLPVPLDMSVLYLHCVSKKTFQQCKNFENRLRFDKVRDSLKVGRFFLRHSVQLLLLLIFTLLAFSFLGGLLRVDLIKWISNVRPPSHMSIRPSIRTQKVCSISMKFGMQVEVDEWCMTLCSMTRSKVKLTSPWMSEIRPFSTVISSPIYNGGWQMTTDS